MSFVPMRPLLMKDPKFAAIASCLSEQEDFLGAMRTWLGVGPDMAADEIPNAVMEGIVVRGLLIVWAVAVEHGKPDGDDAVVPKFSLGNIDRITGTPSFGAAMREAGWAATANDGVRFPKFTKTVILGQPAPAVAKKPRSRPRPTTPKERERNPLFDTIAQVTGFDPATAGGAIGKAAASLAKAEPPYSIEDVAAFGNRFYELCPWAAKDRMKPTPQVIEKYIGLLRHKKIAPPRNTGGQFKLPEA